MSDTSARRPVVVGVDGSEPSQTAVDRAAQEATDRDLPLEIVHAYLPSPPLTAQPISAAPHLAAVPPAGELEASEAALREQAEQLLHDAATRVRTTHPNLPVVTRLRHGHPAEVLVEASRSARVLVVGHRGLGGFAGLLVGSIAIQVVNHAAAPVIVARGQPSETGPVVVGVDGSQGSRRAAAFAVDAAAVRKAAVVALYAWPADAAWQPAPEQLGQPPPTVPDEVTSTLAAVSSEHPSVQVEPEVRVGRAHELLVAASEHARLVVVGSRGRGGFRGLLLGSVSQALINHAGCPVAVVGPDADPPSGVDPT